MADPGTIAAFADFMTATRQRPMSGPDKIMNMMSTHRTYASKVIMSGLNATQYFQDGTEIVEQIQLKYTPNARSYLPTDAQTPTGTNSLTQIKIPWRFSLVDSVWYDHEIQLNNGDMATVFKNLKNVKRQAMYTDFWDYINNCLWATPATAMEGGNSSGIVPYSIPYFVTAVGGAPTSGTGVNQDNADTSATLVETVDPSLSTNWKSQYATYNSASIDTTLIDALDRMYIKLQFEAPDDSGKTGIQDSPMTKQCIFTNAEGYATLVRLARYGTGGGVNDKLAANLGWFNGKVTYNGTMVKYISALDAGTNGGATGAAGCVGGPTGSPRFYFLNFNWIKFIFNKSRFLNPTNFDGTVTQPFAHVEYRDTWWNLVCTNRREQGMVRAAAAGEATV